MKHFSLSNTLIIEKKVNIVFFYLLLLFALIFNNTSAQSGIFAGGPIYYDAEFSIDELRNSGFTTVIVWTIHVNEDGDLNFNGEFLVCEDGKYVGNAKYPDFPTNMALLKTSPSSINRVEVGLSAWASTTFDHIKNLVNSEGTGPNSILYKNFKALLEEIPSIDAINFDDESTYDEPSATTFAVMLADLGYKVTTAPYTARTFWKDFTNNTNTQRPGTIDAVYLQCYAGGSGNNPCSWQSDYPEIPIYPGLWGGPQHSSASEVENQMDTWQSSCNISGGFLWLYDDIKNSDAVVEYASAINNALDIVVTNEGAGNPSPKPGEKEVDQSIDLSWSAGINVISHDLYFGTNTNPEFVSNLSDTIYSVSSLLENTQYYWQVNEITATDTIIGPIWSFRTVYPLPGLATNPNPANGATEVNVLNSLGWTSGEYSTSHDLYLGTSGELGAEHFIGNFTENLYQSDTLDPETIYYWRVDPINKTGKSTGEVWSFTTKDLSGDTLGSSLKFDGIDDYVNLGNSSQLQITGNSITLEAWVNASEFKSQIWQGSIIAKDYSGGAGADYGFALRCGGTGQFDVVLGNGNWVELASPPNSLGLNSWYHIAATFNGSQIILYLNGEEVAKRNASFSISNNPNSVRVGESPGFPGRVFNGKIDEVRIWNISRTQEEIKNFMNGILDESILNNENSGLVGYYQFDENGGQVVHNSSFYQTVGVLGKSADADNNDPEWSTSEIILVGVDDHDYSLPKNFMLAQNYPNPFNPSTSIQFSIPSASNVKLKLYDVLGNEIKTLINENKSPGNYSINFNAEELASGIYIYRLESNNSILSKKMILLK